MRAQPPGIRLIAAGTALTCKMNPQIAPDDDRIAFKQIAE
jgi:hypothetical protein